MGRLPLRVVLGVDDMLECSILPSCGRNCVRDDQPGIGPLRATFDPRAGYACSGGRRSRVWLWAAPGVPGWRVRGGSRKASPWVGMGHSDDRVLCAWGQFALP